VRHDPTPQGLNSLDAVPQEERDTLVLALCYARALLTAGYPAVAQDGLRAARARVEQDYSAELHWKAELLAAYAAAEAEANSSTGD
jgi:hypothetical protein